MARQAEAKSLHTVSAGVKHKDDDPQIPGNPKQPNSLLTSTVPHNFHLEIRNALLPSTKKL